LHITDALTTPTRVYPHNRSNSCLHPGWQASPTATTCRSDQHPCICLRHTLPFILSLLFISLHALYFFSRSPWFLSRRTYPTVRCLMTPMISLFSRAFTGHVFVLLYGIPCCNIISHLAIQKLNMKYFLPRIQSVQFQFPPVPNLHSQLTPRSKSSRSIDFLFDILVDKKRCQMIISTGCSRTVMATVSAPTPPPLSHKERWSCGRVRTQMVTLTRRCEDPEWNVDPELPRLTEVLGLCPCMMHDMTQGHRLSGSCPYSCADP
jgi:hypothetical protein